MIKRIKLFSFALSASEALPTVMLWAAIHLRPILYQERKKVRKCGPGWPKRVTESSESLQKALQSVVCPSEK